MTPRTYHGRSKYRGAMARRYDARRARQRRWCVEQRVVRDFVATLAPGTSVLDIPIGTGRFVPLYRARKLAVHGADVSLDMLRQAEAHRRPGLAAYSLSIADAEAIPYRDAAVETLVCHRFLKWLPDLAVVESVVAELARVASRRILLQAKLDRRGDAPDPRTLPPEAPRRYRHRDLVTIFERVGLRIEQRLDVPAIGSNIHYYRLTKPLVTPPRDGPCTR